VGALGETDLDRLDTSLQAMLRAIPDSGGDVSATSLAFGAVDGTARRRRRTTSGA